MWIQHSRELKNSNVKTAGVFVRMKGHILHIHQERSPCILEENDVLWFYIMNWGKSI